MSEFNAVLFPKVIFIRFGMLVLHVPHVDVHERRSGEKVFGFGRNDRNPVIRMLADVPGGGDAADAIAEDYDMLHLVENVDRVGPVRWRIDSAFNMDSRQIT